MLTPKNDLETLATWGTEYLTQVIAIESQSDEHSETIPSTEGQRHLSNVLRGFFEGLGFAAEQDDFANLIVTIEANVEAKAAGEVPAVAFMVHMDTAEGTQAVPALAMIPAWDGGRVPYPDNDRLNVSAEAYAVTRWFVGEDVLHGPGAAPIGLDDKLGMAELMTLARILVENPELPHGKLLLVFRPDEEIGRMAAVEGLADLLKARGVTYGYTVDGLAPFEVNVENFNASRATVSVPAEVLGGDTPGQRVDVAITGVKAHGATAKSEGHLNALTIMARAMKALDGAGVTPVAFETHAASETDAVAGFLVADSAAEARLLAALRAELREHAWKGAYLESQPAKALDGTERLGLDAILAFLDRFWVGDGPSPLLAEDSDGYEGYTNPYAINQVGERWVLQLRVRDFDPDALETREQHVVAVANEIGLNGAVAVERQYINMGPKMAAFPELVEWATDALAPLGKVADTCPIRGGTGVDPFLARGIPVANLGTGYFAPESEKELTSRQNVGRHALWLAYLVQVVVG